MTAVAVRLVRLHAVEPPRSGRPGPAGGLRRRVAGHAVRALGRLRRAAAAADLRDRLRRHHRGHGRQPVRRAGTRDRPVAALPAAGHRGHPHRAGVRRAGRGRDRHAAGRRLPGHRAERGRADRHRPAVRHGARRAARLDRPAGLPGGRGLRPVHRLASARAEHALDLAGPPAARRRRRAVRRRGVRRRPGRDHAPRRAGSPPAATARARTRGRSAGGRRARPRRSRPAGCAPRPAARRSAGSAPRRAAAARPGPVRAGRRRPRA